MIALFPRFVMSIASSPSPSLQPAEVVEAQLRALQQGNTCRCFEFASPSNRRVTGPLQRFEIKLRQTPAYSPLVGCSSFEILSALSLSPNRWTCRVRVRPAGSSCAPFAVSSPFVEYKWELSRQPEKAAFNLGQCFRHRKYNYRGVIVGYDAKCEQTEKWISQMNVDELTQGRDQHFYHVLVDTRDRPGAQVTYVAEENICADLPSEPLRHPAISQHFSSFDAERAVFEPHAALLMPYFSPYPGCWMVDGVVLDQPVIE